MSPTVSHWLDYAVQRSTVQFIEVIKCSSVTVQCSTLNSAVQYGTEAQCSTLNYSTVQCSVK